LIGELQDGSSFRFDLNSIQVPGEDFASGVASIQLYSTNAGACGQFPTTEAFTFRGLSLPGNNFDTDLAMSDDIHSRFQNGFVLNSAEFPLSLVFEGTLPAKSLLTDSIDFNIESNAITPGLTQYLELFNYSTNSHEFFGGGRTPSFNVDTIETIELPAESIQDYLDPFVEQGSLGANVRARVSWRQTGFILVFPWGANVDHVFWSFN